MTRRGDWTAHLVLLLGVAVFVFPIWGTLVASTQDAGSIGRGDISLLPGRDAIENYVTAWTRGGGRSRSTGVEIMMLNSLVMAIVIAVGKIAISLLSAYAVVFFSFPLRM